MNWMVMVGILILIMATLLIIMDAGAGEVRTEFRDRYGHFQGSSLTNRYGTTTYYDRNGYFQGTETRHK